MANAINHPFFPALAFIAAALLFPAPVSRADTTGVPASGCTAEACHQGIEPIRGPSSPMMLQIMQRGARAGDPAGCVVCHGGNPGASTTGTAHRGAPAVFSEQSGPQGFYPDPGSPWINEQSCGPCHAEWVEAQWNSLMMTEAGKIQGTAWSFGSLEGYDHGWGNYDARNPADQGLRRGTELYRASMERLRLLEPQVFPESLTTLPAAPVDLSQLASHPELAAFSYIRTECQRCHLAVKGRERRGDYRGMGCSACHIPYGNEGLYEGSDRSIPHDEPGHLLVHTIQSSRKTEVLVHDAVYTGIPVETCTTCHDRGKRIGVSFQGLMESPYKTPFTDKGEDQPGLHTKHYMALQEDIHYRKGMVCQDCHSSIDIHGDRFLACTTLAPVEIECADCHGTPDAYPWELPLGFGDEFEETSATGEPRGISTELYPSLAMGWSCPPEDGYLLTARGNPYPEVVRRGNLVVVHTAGGKDLELTPLKLLADEERLGTGAGVAMQEVGSHLDRMECYSCHASWAPQCYGCHLRIDYSGNKRSFDWVAAGHRHREAGHAADAGEKEYDCTLAGEVSESRSYLRFEDPALGVNGEGRISPVIPGCQTTVTVIGPDGETILTNHIFRSLPGTEGSGEEGQLCIDMSPANPHTSGPPRSCESCHLSEKALGHGIGGGRLHRPWDEAVTVDLRTADGRIIPLSARPQFEAVDGLSADWSRFVTEDGEQLQTVGHHFSLSRPLNDGERSRTDRQGVCLSCHQEIPRESLAVSLLHHTAEYGGVLPENAAEHSSLLHKILLFAAWGQVGGGIFAGLGLFLSTLLVVRRRWKH